MSSHTARAHEVSLRSAEGCQAGYWAGAGHVVRTDRLRICCDAGALGDELHLVFDCAALANLR